MNQPFANRASSPHHARAQKKSGFWQKPDFFRAAGGLWAILLILIAAGPIFAAPAPQATQPVPAKDSAIQPVDVVVLLDDSGSMDTCWPWPRDGAPFRPPCRAPSFNQPSDPAGLRYSAARLLIQLADDDDRIAVIRFDSGAAGVGELGALQPIGDEANRRRLSAELQPPTSYAGRGYTRFDLALDEAVRVLESGRQPGRSRYVLLLSDGEPSQPDGVGSQRPRVQAQIATLEENDVLIFPVTLCNPSSGCAGDFLREEFAVYGVREAATAADLLQIFSQILGDMKPDRSTITGADNGGGDGLQVNIRDAHGAQQLAFVTAKGDLLSVERDGQPTLARAALDDPNVSVAIVDREQLASGLWTATTGNGSGFVVAQAESYPQLINPPPSVAESPASVRYYPAGKPPLLIAQGHGPGADEIIYYNGDVALEPFGNGVHALALSEEPGPIRLQLGDDQAPLQLIRTFQLEARADLPTLQIFSPTPGDPGLLEDGRQRLQVGFGGGRPVSGLAATVYVTDETDDAQGGGQLVYQAEMTCDDQLCSDERFTPGDGRDYKITYVLAGEVDGVRFSDWGQTTSELAPAVYLRGLPAQLDLSQMPPDGWPIELAAGTTEPIGDLKASIRLSRLDDQDPTLSEPVSGVTLDFLEDVPEEGALQTALKVAGLASLRPGDYVGTIDLEATNPSGLPMDVAIRPAPEIPVTLTVPRPQATLLSQTADFGSALFDTSPNFRLDQEVLVPVEFSGDPFPVDASLTASSCPGLSVEAGEVRREGGRLVLPLHLTSAGPMQPATCTGTLALSGPDDYHDVTPQTVDWRSRVNAVEWSLVNGALNLGDLQDAGAQATGELLIRFNGKTPFILEMDSIDVTGESGDGPLTLTGEDLEMPPVEVNGPPDENGVYRVPVALAARRDIPFDPLRGSYYSGDLALRVVGLDPVERLGVAFRSPNFVQRYIAPIVVPVYSLPWALLTVPLTLLLVLIAMARFRGRNFDEDEIEEAAMAATMQMAANQPPEPLVVGDSGGFVPANPGAADAAWGQSEWGAPWGDDAPAPGAASAPPASARPDDDPWSSSW